MYIIDGMSKKTHRKKMLHVGINTEALLFEDESKKPAMRKPSHLKERNVKHIKIMNDASALQEIYNFEEQIGQGSFGTVMSVVDKTTEKNWAMKIVNKSAISDKIPALQREILILKMVEHPHIIYLDKVYESAKKIYLILERCYGELSRMYKEKKPFSEVETRKVICDLASAVAYLHKNDIVHRDLKLENILIAKNPNDPQDELYIKVSDFGLSTVKQGSGYEDMLHDCCGTIMYMAPEIITSHSYSQQCDVWAIGVIMFMLLGGRYPFYSSNEQELMTMICKNEPTYAGFTASNEATHLITKMLAKNPALRITAAEVVLHPWVVGKQMTHESDSPENVLDMMRLWRSEMMVANASLKRDLLMTIVLCVTNKKLPVGDECDWVSSAKAVGSSEDLLSKEKKNIARKEPQPDNFANGAASATPRRQSMHLPVKNIRFDRSANESSNATPGAPQTGRRASIAVGVEDLHASRRGNLSPPIQLPTSSKRSTHMEQQRGTTRSLVVGNSKSSTPQPTCSKKRIGTK